jgi:Siphovirus ReqiPepy6 Gp37-like protein
MIVYTLDENFLRREVVDDFYSLIWTERYSKAGDVTLSVPLTKANVAKMPEGTYLAMPKTKEVMIVDSALIEKNQLKLTGSSLIKFLNERPIRTSAAHEDRYYNINAVPGVAITQVVSDTCITGPFVASGAYGIDGPRQIISGLYIVSSDVSGVAIAFAIPFGSLYDAIAQIADTYSVGMRMYLDDASSSGYRLGFMSYAGVDRTSRQSVNPIVRFSPAMDSLTNIKELRSVAGYKNVAYAFAPSNPGGLATTPGIAYADSDAAASTGFKRRVLMVFADDITTDKIGGSAAVLQQMLNQRAADGLANNNYTKVVDGEVVPQSQFKYGRDYTLGDIVELQSVSGLATRARITEYIRTQDATGERAYPTVSVID